MGRKSGVERSCPLACFPDGDDAWLVVAPVGGAANNPVWYYNLAAHPNRARIEIDGRTIAVSAEQLHGQAREEAWRRIKNDVPRFAKYEQKTDRELPVIRLQASSPVGT